MNRRESLRTILYGSASATVLAGCMSIPETAVDTTRTQARGFYGRLQEEVSRDERLLAERFFDQQEIADITWLANVIIPADGEHGGAIEAGVPDFIEFIVKDLPDLATPIRGGLQWLNATCRRLYGTALGQASERERMELIDKIAYPLVAEPTFSHGVEFFNLFRNITATGYFTSAIGIAYLGYQGNVANVWDGVPEHVLANYQLEYDEKTLAHCLRVEDRDKFMEW